MVPGDAGAGVGAGQGPHLGHPVAGNNNLNINLPENNNAILRLEVELRDKNVPKYRRGVGGPGRGAVAGRGAAAGAAKRGGAAGGVGLVGAGAATRGAFTGAGGGTKAMPLTDGRNLVVPLEKVSSNRGGGRGGTLPRPYTLNADFVTWTRVLSTCTGMHLTRRNVTKAECKVKPRGKVQS